ncbi:hypothetical protein GCM10008937_25710 [Deinococcus depolymerans]|uniref:Uncharacterized protein n=1 Tax=Deinococcus depolymerans TaxID=392408 RepID=A0ABP3MDW7_9DEIO
MPSASVRYAPCALAMKRGVPPTLRKARTGLFTPPGVTARARANSASDCAVGAGRTAETGSVFMTLTLAEAREASADPGTQKPAVSLSTAAILNER